MLLRRLDIEIEIGESRRFLEIGLAQHGPRQDVDLGHHVPRHRKVADDALDHRLRIDVDASARTIDVRHCVDDRPADGADAPGERQRRPAITPHAVQHGRHEHDELLDLRTTSLQQIRSPRGGRRWLMSLSGHERSETRFRNDYDVARLQRIVLAQIATVDQTAQSDRGLLDRAVVAANQFRSIACREL